MYAITLRRRLNESSKQETIGRAHTEFFPKLKEAQGFKSLTLIEGEDGVITVLIVFDIKAKVDAFQGTAQAWMRTLDELGHKLESHTGGEVAEYFTASA